MMRLVNHYQRRPLIQLHVMLRQPLYRHHLYKGRLKFRTRQFRPTNQRCLKLFHQLTPMSHNPHARILRPLHLVRNYAGQHMRLTRTRGHLHHNGPTRPKSRLNPLLHFYLIIVKPDIIHNHPSDSLPSSPYLPSLASYITDGSSTSTVCHSPCGTTQP